MLFQRIMKNCMFVTLFYGVLNFKNNFFHLCQCRDITLLLKSQLIKQYKLFLLQKNPPLDADPNAVFHENTIEFQPGETLFSIYRRHYRSSKQQKRNFLENIV